VKLQEAENQIVIDYEVYAQRPNDSDLLMSAIEAHAAKLGRIPRLVAADRRVLLHQERGGGESQRRHAGLYPQSRQQECRAQARTEEAMVPQRAAMAHRVRGTHQCQQTLTRSPAVPTRRRWNDEPGRPRVIADNLINIGRTIAAQLATWP
jgi:transposase, IS5 family